MDAVDRPQGLTLSVGDGILLVNGGEILFLDTI
jgi:hypothetical protein